MLSNDMAALIGFGCEAVMYGAYCIIFLVSLLSLVSLRGTRDLNIPMLGANCFLFSLCTAHFALEFNHFYTTLQTTGVLNYANETKTLFGADILISLTDFVGDMVLLYRCWLVWGKNYYIIILPFLTALAGFASLMEVLHLLLGINPSAPVAPDAIVPLGIAGYALPLGTNVMITVLIVGRIWYVSRGAKALVGSLKGFRSASDTARRAMSIIIESGVLYLVTQLIFVVLFAMQHPAQAIMAVVAVQIYGIAPTMIIIRVGLGISSEQTSKGPNDATHISWSHPSSKHTGTTTHYTEDTASMGRALANEISLEERKSMEGSSTPSLAV